MKDIILRIKDNDGIEFTTEGKFWAKGNTTLIQYDETELSGMEGCTTSLTITPTRVRMKRVGDKLQDGTEMIFEKGRRMHGLYATPYGNVAMEILTNSISGLNMPSAERDKLSIDYSISLKGLFDADKKLDIEILSKDEADLADMMEAALAPQPEEKEETFSDFLDKLTRRIMNEGKNDVQ